jgi:molybdate transport system substrate-binding protein
VIRGIGSPRRAASLLLAACVLMGSACGFDTSSGSGSARAAASRTSNELVVLGAASLTEAFTELGNRFEATHRGVAVRFSFGPSDGLAAQIDNGAPADVFASASETWMDDVESNGPGIEGRTDFARNKLLLITPSDDPAHISSLRDLGAPGIKLVLAAKDVPVGTYAREALARVGVGAAAEANVVSNEQDVKAVLQKVLLGEADAGIVYRTDLTPDVAPDLNAIDIPKDQNVIATYPIGVVAGGPNTRLAEQFVALVTGAQGQRILLDRAFLPPPN